MSEQGYNGYTNYETWNIALWIDNDQQEYWIEQAKQADSIHELEQNLKEYYNENMPEVHGTYADLLQSALDSVNWYEIAENMFTEYHQEEETESE